MSYLGWFDGELRPDAWFDAELQPAAWFDTEIVNTSTAGNTAVNLGVGSLSITGYAPTVTQALSAGYSFAVIHEYRDNGSISVTSWIPLNHLTAQGANASYVVRGSQGINSWSYVVPSASGVVDTPINPGVGSITFTGYAPTIAQGANQSILPAVGSLTIMGYAPTLAQTANQAVSPGAGTLTITGYAPTVTQSSSASYGVAHSYVTRGSQSIVSWLNDGLGAVSGTITPGAGTLTITGHAPTIGQTVTVAINPGAGSLTITGYAPSIAQTANVSLVPGVGSLSITGYAPTVSQTVSTAVVGVVHNYSARGTQAVLSWLNDGLSVPVAADLGSNTAVLLRRRRR